jgi:hypothetical protein
MEQVAATAEDVTYLKEVAKTVVGLVDTVDYLRTKSAEHDETIHKIYKRAWA